MILHYKIIVANKVSIELIGKNEESIILKNIKLGGSYDYRI